jgi:hypothetical protein
LDIGKVWYNKDPISGHPITGNIGKLEKITSGFLIVQILYGQL